MRVSDAVRMVSVIAMEEFGAFATRLKSKPKERVLVTREYGVEMALNAHRVETMAKKYKQVRAAADKFATGVFSLVEVPKKGNAWSLAKHDFFGSSCVFSCD